MVMIIDDVLPVNYGVMTGAFVCSVLKLALGFIVGGNHGRVTVHNFTFWVMMLK